MSKNIKLLSAAALAATVITPAMAVEAATPVNQDGVYFVYEGQNTYMTLTELVNDADMSYYVSELGLDKVTVIQDGEAGTYIDFLENKQVNLEDYDLPAGEYKDSQGNIVELTGDKPVGEVTSVKAINNVIASGTSEEITFEVNGKEYTLAEFNKAFEGYTVEFFTNNKDISITDGKVTATADFKYAVQVTDEAGNKVPAEQPLAKDFADVKVEDAKVATKIHAIGLAKVTEDGTITPWENPTVTAEDTKAKDLQIVATEFENALGDKNTDVKEDGKTPTEKAEAIEAPEVKTAVSSDPTVAYYEDGVIVRNKDGKVTFTVTFEGDQFKGQEFKLEVTAKAEQKATSIEAKDLKVKADEAQTFDIKVLDQDGEEMRKDTDLFYTSTATGKPEAAKATKVEGDVKFAAGNHVVNIYADAEKKTKLGSFKVEAVDVSEDAEIEEYKFVVAGDSKDEEGNVKPLDLNTEVNNKELKLNVEAYIQDIKVGLKDGVELEADSSDDEVAKVAYKQGVATVTAEKVGKATITLYTVEGQMKTPVATYEVEVTDSTKPVETLTLKDNTKVIVKDAKAELEELAAAVQAAVKEENITDKIAEVVTVEANGIVIVTMKEEYGGKEFPLDAIYGVAELTKAKYTAAVVGEEAGQDTPAVAAKATIGGVDFEAVEAGEAGNQIQVEIKNTEESATDSSNVASKVEFADNKLTVTIGAEWDAESSESKASELTVADLKTLIEGNDAAKAAIKVTTEDGNTEVQVTTNAQELAGGVDFKAGDEAVEATPAKVTFTFSEAVKLEGDFKVTVKAEDGKETTLPVTKATLGTNEEGNEDNKKVVVELSEDVEGTQTITKLEGVQAVKGIVIVPESGVTFEVNAETEED